MSAHSQMNSGCHASPTSSWMCSLTQRRLRHRGEDRRGAEVARRLDPRQVRGGSPVEVEKATISQVRGALSAVRDQRTKCLGLPEPQAR